MPLWFGPPRGTLPAVVPLERVLARTEKVAVCVTGLGACPIGFEFDVVTMSADRGSRARPAAVPRAASPSPRVGRREHPT